MKLAAALACAAIGCAACTGRTQPAGLATWVWKAETVVEPGARTRLVSFLQHQGADQMYLQLDPRYERESFAELCALLASAQQAGVRVLWVDGAPDWALPGSHRAAFAALERARRINQLLAAAGRAGIAGILFDIEPYLLAEWTHDRAQVLRGYDGLSLQLQAAARAGSLELWWTLPFWFLERAGAETHRLIERGDGVVVMAYRDRPERVTELSRQWLAAAETRGRRVIVAIETGCIEPRHVTFCGRSRMQLTAAMSQIRSELATSPAFSGLAVHQYSSWHALGGDP